MGSQSSLLLRKHGKRWKTSRGAVFCLGKRFNSLWSVLYSTFSSVSHCLLFQLWALILSRLVHSNHEKIQPLLFVLPGMLSKCRQIWRAFCCFVLVTHWTETASDLPGVLWDSATEKRELQVNNEPPKVSLVVPQLSIEIVSWCGSFQLIVIHQAVRQHNWLMQPHTAPPSPCLCCLIFCWIQSRSGQLPPGEPQELKGGREWLSELAAQRV